MLDKMETRFYWERMAKDCKKYVETCEIYQTNKTVNHYTKINCNDKNIKATEFVDNLLRSQFLLKKVSPKIE